MKEFDPDLSLAENWQTADPLNFAWFEYAPSEMKERYRDAGRNPHLTATLKRLMEGEVQLKISDGELVALGVQLEPNLEDSGRAVPPVLFQADSTIIDWENGIVRGLDRRFVEVRVCWSGIAATELPTPARPSNIDPLGKASPTRPSDDGPPTAKKRTGRPSYSEGLKIVAAALESQNVALDSRPWKPLFFQVRSLGAEMKLANFHDQHPDDETIRRFLFKRAATKPSLKTQ